ncbi:hypothetical protein [Streptomyces sp. NPDC058653]|uniref:hypothetical protein n=1 Tax=Streptomyces sp. NPDC058653 TaxID=3346576 RepID=UPI00365EB5CE
MITTLVGTPDPDRRPLTSARITNPLADARCVETRARNLRDALLDLPKSERPAVRAEMRALYAEAAGLRQHAQRMGW